MMAVHCDEVVSGQLTITSDWTKRSEGPKARSSQIGLQVCYCQEVQRRENDDLVGGGSHMHRHTGSVGERRFGERNQEYAIRKETSIWKYH